MFFVSFRLCFGLIVIIYERIGNVSMCNVRNEQRKQITICLSASNRQQKIKYQNYPMPNRFTTVTTVKLTHKQLDSPLSIIVFSLFSLVLPPVTHHMRCHCVVLAVLTCVCVCVSTLKPIHTQRAARIYAA